MTRVFPGGLASAHQALGPSLSAIVSLYNFCSDETNQNGNRAVACAV